MVMIMLHILIYWSLLYSAIPRSWAGSLHSHVILHEWIAFYSAFLNIHRSGVLTALAWLVPQESAARESQSRHVLRTPYKHAPCHFMQSHICKVYACLAVTCHLRFLAEWLGSFTCYCGNMGVERILNKSQHRKLTLEKKILPPFQQGLEPATYIHAIHTGHAACTLSPSVTYLIDACTHTPPAPQHIHTHSHMHTHTHRSMHTWSYKLEILFKARTLWWC